MKHIYISTCIFLTSLIFSFTSIGQLQWYKSYGNIGFSSGEDVATDSIGNIYVTGHLWRTLNVGGTTLVSNGDADIFLGKWDPDGNFRWAKGIGNSDEDDGHSIYTDRAGNSYITGQFTTTVSFDSYNLDAANGRIFLAKYNASGTCLWAYNYGNSS